MPNRERLLIIVTLVAFSVYMLDAIGGVDAMVRLVSFNRAEIENLRKQNQEYREQLEGLIQIREQFQEIERMFETRTARDPRFVFTEDLSLIFQTIGETAPVIKPARSEVIPDVTEYEYLTVEVEANRMPEERFRELMKRLHEENIIVQQIRVNAMTTMAQVGVTMKVARILRTGVLNATP